MSPAAISHVANLNHDPFVDLPSSLGDLVLVLLLHFLNGLLVSLCILIFVLQLSQNIGGVRLALGSIHIDIDSINLFVVDLRQVSFVFVVALVQIGGGLQLRIFKLFLLLSLLLQLLLQVLLLLRCQPFEHSFVVDGVLCLDRAGALAVILFVFFLRIIFSLYLLAEVIA